MSSPANSELTSPVAASATSCDDMSHWASLHEDLVLLVGWRVLAGDLLDYVRFRAVCIDWRSATVCPRGRGITDPRFHPRRWMMLPEGHALHPNDDGDKRRFFNLSTAAFVRPRLTLLRNHQVISTVEGLLLLAHQPQDQEKYSTIRFLHPFTGDIADLPPIFMGHRRSQMVSYLRGRLTVCLRVGVDGVATVMMMLSYLPFVLFAATNDKQWSHPSWSFPRTSMRTISFQGNLYTIQDSAAPIARPIFQIGPLQYEHGSKESGFGSLSLPPPKEIAVCPAALHGPVDLVECDSEILLIGFTKVMNMLVYRLADLILGKVLPVTNIGGNTIFLDIGRSLSPEGLYNFPDPGKSIAASHKVIPTIEGDTIVRRHPRKSYIGEYCLYSGERYVEQYHLSSGTWTPTPSG